MFFGIYWLLSLACCFAFLDEIDKTRINRQYAKEKRGVFVFVFQTRKFF